MTKASDLDPQKLAALQSTVSDRRPTDAPATPRRLIDSDVANRILNGTHGTTLPRHIEPEKSPDPWDSVVKPTSPYHGCSLDNYRPTCEAAQRVLDATREYAGDIRGRRKKPTGALWFGAVGTGKDHLAIGVLRIAKAAGYRCKVVFGEQFRSQTREVIMSDDQSEAKFLGQFHQDFLLLSDPIPVKGELTPTQSDALMSVMRSRIELGLPTLVTVNVLNRYRADGTVEYLSRQEAEDRMGLPTYDRMANGSYVFECQWGTYRRPEKFVR